PATNKALRPRELPAASRPAPPLEPAAARKCLHHSWGCSKDSNGPTAEPIAPANRLWPLAPHVLGARQSPAPFPGPPASAPQLRPCSCGFCQRSGRRKGQVLLPLAQKPDRDRLGLEQPGDQLDHRAAQVRLLQVPGRVFGERPPGRAIIMLRPLEMPAYEPPD